MTLEEGMELALLEAAKVRGRTAPNPNVGAVLVADGRVIGVGSTQPFGGAHAEVVALKAAAASGADVRGATLFVTLEPCCHYGNTPPCTDAIIAAGIGKVVVGVIDPYEKIRGRGIQLLREAGIEVNVGVMAKACRRMMLGFLRTQEGGLPEVTVKAAVSLDGRIATASGESQWITGPIARAHGHGLRATHDAILVGRGTVEADDPRLTCRVESGVDPVPVVLDTKLTISESAKVLQGPKRAIICAGMEADERVLNGEVLRLPSSAKGIDLVSALRALGQRGLHRVLIEGGGEVIRSAFDAGVVDTLELYVAGVVIPGGRSWLGGDPVDALALAPRLGTPTVEALGEDVLLHYELPEKGEG